MRKSLAGQDQACVLSYSPSAILGALILCWCLKVASEEAELLAALDEYERDIYLLESLYNENKALLDQHHLDIDLRELAGYAWSPSFSYTSDKTQNRARS